MRHWMYTTALGGVAALTIGGLFVVDLFAGKPGDPRDDNKPVAPKSSKDSEVALGTRSESAAKLPVTKVAVQKRRRLFRTDR